MRILRSLQQAFGLAASASGLQPPMFRELPMGSIKSAGWIDAELQTSLQGLSGQLQNFYSQISDGTFTGGSTSYSALNEAQPYYFQAAVPAVYTTDAPAGLRSWVDKTMTYFLEHQSDDGWFGPKPDILWPRWPVLLGAMHYAEAVPEKQDGVVDFIYKFVNVSHTMLSTRDTGSSDPTDGGQSGMEEWGSVRTAEYVLLLQWLYELHPRDDKTQAMLLSDMTLVRLLGNRKMGDYDNTGWTGFFAEQNFNKDGSGPRNQRSHGVNVAMALKEAALTWRVSGAESDRLQSRQAWDLVYKYHGKSAGHFAADEHLAGLLPHRGAETCQVVENMWSSSITYAVLGESQDADRAEMLAFNSLPGAVTGDWWGRQYLQQEIQLSSQPFETNPFASDGPESNVFGLETNYPCCTVNHPQGLPRFISRAYLTKGDDTLLHAYLIPSTVSATLASNNKVTVTAKTNYPFEDTIRYTFQAQQSFQFAVRVPQWATSAILRSSTGAAASGSVSVGMVTIAIPAGSSSATYVVSSEEETIATPGGHPNSVSIRKGALLYSLPVDYTLSKLRQNAVQPKAIDNIRLPKNTTAWMVAIDPSSATFVDLSGAQGGGELRSPVFDQDNAPVAVRVNACAATQAWDSVDDGQWLNGFPPANSTCEGGDTAMQSVVLKPYGAAKLRIATLASIVEAPSASRARVESGIRFIKHGKQCPLGH